jgi:hypothetical protein
MWKECGAGVPMAAAARDGRDKQGWHVHAALEREVGKGMMGSSVIGGRSDGPLLPTVSEFMPLSRVASFRTLTRWAGYE